MTTFEYKFDEARVTMYDTLTEQFGEERVQKVLGQSVRDQLTELYNSRDRLATEDQVPEVAANE